MERYANRLRIFFLLFILSMLYKGEENEKVCLLI